MATYDQIFENNRKWVAEKKASDKEFFEKLAKGQNSRTFSNLLSVLPRTT